MFSRTTVVAILLVGALGIFVFISELTLHREFKMNNETVTAVVDPTDNVKLILDVPNFVSFGQPAMATLVLLNSGNEKLQWGYVGKYQDAKIDVIDSSGKPCPYTSFGFDMMGGENEGPYIPMSLYPGESINWTIDLTECFELTPGDYTVQAATTYNLLTLPQTVEAKRAMMRVSKLEL